MTDDVAIDKTSMNKSLIHFNDQIVSVKSVVKKAKINEIQRLIRKIKLLNNKKGNENQLGQNKRKAENLKKEVEKIKKLKFNDVAMFSFENEFTKFQEYVSKTKNPKGNELSLARLAFNKLVVDSINKIKANPKISGWKTVFIQYKARCEKRKGWKEKMSRVKEIEAKLTRAQENEDKDNSDNEEDMEPESEVISETYEMIVSEGMEVKSVEKKVVVAKKVMVTEKEVKVVKKVVEKSAKSEASIVESIDNLMGDCDDVISGSDSEEKTNLPMNLDDYELGGFSSDDSDGEAEAPVFLDKKSLLLGSGSDKSESESESEPEKKTVNVVTKKPIVFENKATGSMVIKQFNLEDMKDLSEIPIQDKGGSVSGDESDGEKSIVSSAEESGQDDEQEVEELNPVKKVKKKKYAVSEDPFFLDSKGNEIFNSEFDHEREQFRNSRRFDDNVGGEGGDYGPNSYSSYDRYQSMQDNHRQKRSDGGNSSFTPSLSSGRGYQGRDFGSSRGRGGFESRGRGRGGFEASRGRGGFESSRGRGGFESSRGRGGFESSRGRGGFESSRGRGGFESSRGRGGFESSRGRGGFESSRGRGGFVPRGRGSFETRGRGGFGDRGRGGYQQSYSAPAPVKMDTSNLHPSWQAKLQMQDRGKLKFEGKKVKFDD